MSDDPLRGPCETCGAVADEFFTVVWLTATQDSIESSGLPDDWEPPTMLATVCTECETVDNVLGAPTEVDDER